MTIHEIKQKIAELQRRYQALVENKQPSELSSELQTLQKQTVSSDFWNDQAAAQKIMRRIGYLENEIGSLDQIQKRVAGLASMVDDAEEVDDEVIELLEAEVDIAENEIDELEVSTFLSGKFDQENVLLSINAGAGGTEAMDWAQMLSRMYIRYSNNRDWQVKVVDQVPGPEAGVSSISMEIYGEFAYGYLKYEHGTHRLVRISPFNAAGQRQTSFAGVEVSPLVDHDIEIEIPDSDIEFQAVRSSGAGGQSVNKTSSAVRIKHKPSGILVAYSGERSQLQNRQRAMQILKAKLYMIEEQKQQHEQSQIKGEYKQASWGNQIRNYVLQPYKLVKDTRTGVESTDPDAVLDGDIDKFVNSQIRKL